MKNAIILFVDKNSKYQFEKVFGEKSAFDMAVAWAEKLSCKDIYLFSSLSEESLPDSCKYPVVYMPEWTVLSLFEKMNEIASSIGSGNIIFAWADCPFLNIPLTETCIQYQTEFTSEYTYAEGYPYGFSPEIINSDTIKILIELARGVYAQSGEKKLSRSGIFDFLKNDINSFEIETVLSENDWRLFRFSFCADKKTNFLGCCTLYEKAGPLIEKGESADRISETASKITGVFKTVPAYYNLQVSKKFAGKPIYYPDFVVSEDIFMSLSDAEKIIEKIHEFSGDGVINLSYFGEPFTNPDLPKIIEKILSNPNFSVFIETDGLLLDEQIIEEVYEIVQKAPDRKNGYEKIMFAVVLDAFSPSKYQDILGRSSENFEKALSIVSKLCQKFPSQTYTQFTRMNENEDELESFFRFWNEKTSPSNGNFIINKYNDFSGLLPARKPADLSPVNRNVCWHLRRDMTILCNGNVLFCQNSMTEDKSGNILTESIDEIWKKTDSEVLGQINGKMCEKCRACDEYYTFNF